MFSLRPVLILVLFSLPAFILPGIAQDTQEAFEKELLAACNKNDLPSIKALITDHRLWVKPVVEQLITEYIEKVLADKKTLAEKEKTDISFLSQSFENIYGEKCLTIGASYLEKWDDHDLLKKAIADSLNTIAISLRTQANKLEEAISVYHDVLNRYEEIGDERGRADVLGGMGYIYWSIDSDTCLSYYLKALETREMVDDRILVGKSLNSIGLVYFQHYFDLDKAIEYLGKACKVREEIGDVKGLGSSLSYLAMCYDESGDPEQAIFYYNQSFLINQKVGNLNRMAEAKLHSGTLLQTTGNYPQALNHLDTSLNIYTQLSDTLMMGDVQSQTAVVYANIGDYDRALESITIASNLYKSINELWGLASVYNHTGIILHNAGRKEKASEYYLKSLEIYKELDDQENVINLLTNLGAVTFEQNDYKIAEEYQKRGLKISREIEYKAGELPCLINLANTQNRLGQLDEALSTYELALKLCQELDSRNDEWKIMLGFAENYELRGDYDKAIEYNEDGLSKIEELRISLGSDEFKSTYMAKERYVFEDVIHMLGKLHEDSPESGFDLLAFEYVQRCKSRSFMDFMIQTSTTVPNGIHHFKPVTVPEIQTSYLDENTVFLEFSLGDSSSYLWAITEKDYQLVKLPARRILQEQIETLRFALLNPLQDNKEFFYTSAKNLYDQLVRPAEHFLKKNSKLVILPEGILLYLPFEVLMTRELASISESTYSDLPYLVEDNPISYSQSSSAFRSLSDYHDKGNNSEKKGETLIAFGDPVYTNKTSNTALTRDGFSRLEHSGNEVEEIASLFQEGFKEIYLRENALEENVKENNALNGFKYIHFATHGLIDEENPENSSLVLTQGTKSTEDGFLTAAEISNLHLDANLVVLSACQTGLGKMVRGEGIIGLSRAFMFAGTPSVLASLWSVSDASTTMLMQRYYENLIRKKLLTTDALQKAQISMIKDKQYAHPFFWAPFVLIGDWE